MRRILVANRGEIACRVIRSCRKMDITTIAIFSEADEHSLHVELADEAICIGPPEAHKSYLVIDRIIEAAQSTNVDAIHPGYGFLAESATFAEAVIAAGLIWI